MKLELDHILWASPDLEAGVKLFDKLSGVTAAGGGSHPGFGTRNQLASLGDGVYFEVISPDPRQDFAGNRGGAIAALPHPGLLTFAMRTNDVEAVRKAASVAGLSIPAPVKMSRLRPDGIRLEWSILYLQHATFDNMVPFVIDWGASPHPSETAAHGCRLRSFAALHPNSEQLRDIYQAIGVPVEVQRSPRPGFIATLATPQGDLTLI